MAEMIECPRCGVDTAMERVSTAEGGQGWRCPACGEIVVPGAVPRDEHLEPAVHEPGGGRSEDD